LTFKFAGGRFFKNGKAKVFGGGDREGLEEFWGIYGLCACPGHGLTAGGAGGEVACGGGLAVLETIAAEAAGGGERLVTMNGHVIKAKNPVSV